MPLPRTRLRLECLEVREVLSTSGLSATYYDNIDFSGTTHTRTDATVDFNWGTGSPAGGIGADTFSVRWQGQVEPQFSETYTFTTLSNDGVRLWVDGRLLINNWTDHPATEDNGTITLLAGRRFDLRMEFYENGGSAVAQLLWASPSQPRQVIPTSRLFTTTGSRPVAPSHLTATPVSDTIIALAWRDNSADESGFRVERSFDGVTFSPLATVAANVTSFQDAGLLPATTATYRVLAYNAAGDSAFTTPASARTFERVVFVSTTSQFRAAVQAATAGTLVAVRPGTYSGDNFFGNRRGAPGRPIVIAAADPNNKPVFTGGGEGLHFSDAAYLELRDLIIERVSTNGINIDDWDTFDTPSHHLVLSGLIIRDIGTSGNKDGIKLSGVQDFVIENCTIQRWGSGGSGIDMVGCHNGVIANSYFSYTDNLGGNGVEAKGGSTRITIRDNRFDHASTRAIQIGGATGLQHFRPQPPGTYEAKDIAVEGNVIIGSQAAIVFASSEGSVFRFNTIYRPTWYAIRILQENTNPGFVPTRNGTFSDNIVVFRTGEMTAAVNAGSGTAPETFRFARNWWYCENDPSRSRPSLPSSESGGTYGIDPQFVNVPAGDFHTRDGSPASHVGAYAPRG